MNHIHAEAEEVKFKVFILKKSKSEKKPKKKQVPALSVCLSALTDPRTGAETRIKAREKPNEWQQYQLTLPLFQPQIKTEGKGPQKIHFEGN